MTIDELLEAAASCNIKAHHLNSLSGAQGVAVQALAGIHYALLAQAQIARTQLEAACYATRNGHLLTAGDKTNTCARCGLRVPP